MNTRRDYVDEYDESESIRARLLEENKSKVKEKCHG